MNNFMYVFHVHYISVSACECVISKVLRNKKGEEYREKYTKVVYNMMCCCYSALAWM